MNIDIIERAAVHAVEDNIFLNKGAITPRKFVDDFGIKMEGYTNYTFYYIQEKFEKNPNYFFKETVFLR